MNVTPEQTRVAEGGTLNNAVAKIEDRTGLFVAIAALGISMLSTGLWIATAIFGPQIIDAKIQAGAARAEAVAEVARKEASTAKDMVDLDRAKTKAREELKR